MEAIDMVLRACTCGCLGIEGDLGSGKDAYMPDWLGSLETTLDGK